LYGLIKKYKTKVEMLAMNRNTCSLGLFVGDEEKRLKHIDNYVYFFFVTNKETK
jgi:hypothetical protein